MTDVVLVVKSFFASHYVILSLEPRVCLILIVILSD